MSQPTAQALSITPATTDDCSECARLFAEQLDEHGIKTPSESLSRMLMEAVARPDRSLLLLAKLNGQIVGVAYVATILSAEHCGIVAWLEELYVIPEHRSKGIGTELVSAVVRIASDMGAVAVDLEVDASHDRVASLYQRFGFRPLNRSRWVKELGR